MYEISVELIFMAFQVFSCGFSLGFSSQILLSSIFTA